MLDKNKQNISEISNSTINQAQGDIINHGVSVKDVLDIVSSVVADKMTIYHQQAELTARQRLDDFKKKLVDELKDKSEEILEKFNQPSVQLAARKAALGCVQSGGAVEQDNLVDLLIERVSVEEKTTKQHLVDEAIEILPSLSAGCLRLLTFLAFSDLVKQGSVCDYEKWIDCVNPIIENISLITLLDVDFLNQANCTYSLGGFHNSSSFIENQLKTCDLLFRHSPSKEFVDKLLAKFQLTRVDNGFQGIPGSDFNKSLFIVDAFGLMEYPNVKIKYTTLSNVCDGLAKHGYSDVIETFHDYFNETQSYTKEEVEQYFINRNLHWREALDFLKRDDITSLRLKPVGTYIACRQLTKLTGNEVSLDIFYSK